MLEYYEIGFIGDGLKVIEFLIYSSLIFSFVFFY